MKMNSFFSTILLVFVTLLTNAQNQQAIFYTVANAHSHNDYEQAKPFTTAYEAQFGSIEADIYLVNDSLYVGHEKIDVLKHRALQTLYLDSIAYYIRLNHGFPYADSERKLQLLIDVKTSAVSTLNTLVKILTAYPDIIQCRALSIVITGNRPPSKTWKNYPSFIQFDGRFNEKYSEEAWAHVGMVSTDLSDIVKWNGEGSIQNTDSIHLAAAIELAHSRGKKARFWGAPDFPNAWKQFMKMNIDWINTDHIRELAAFLNAGK